MQPECQVSEDEKPIQVVNYFSNSFSCFRDIELLIILREQRNDTVVL